MHFANRLDFARNAFSGKTTFEKIIRYGNLARRCLCWQFVFDPSPTGHFHSRDLRTIRERVSRAMIFRTHSRTSPSGTAELVGAELVGGGSPTLDILGRSCVLVFAVACRVGRNRTASLYRSRPQRPAPGMEVLSASLIERIWESACKG